MGSDSRFGRPDEMLIGWRVRNWGRRNSLSLAGFKMFRRFRVTFFET